MTAVNFSTLRQNLKEYCDKATDESETVIVTRKDEKNVVLMSLERYNKLMELVKGGEYIVLRGTDYTVGDQMHIEQNVSDKDMKVIKKYAELFKQFVE